MKDKKIMKVFLADLGHTYFGISPATIPLGVCYIGAAVKALFNDNLQVGIFRYPEKLQQALKEERPDILGFGLYSWNEYLSAYFAGVARQAYPEIVLVAGGPNIPEEGAEIKNNYIDNYKSLFDVYIPYEGELPMVELVKQLLGSSRKDALSKAIPGCYIFKKDGLLKGEPIPWLGNLSEIPSPYLSGVADCFLDDEMLNSVIQTMRGCPYLCSYCVSGKKDYSKIRLFPFERVKEEILYLKDRAKNRILRITDDNFGILARDIELAEFIAKLYKDEKYPQALKVYTNKTNDEKVKKVMLTLKDLIPYNISLQTTTPSVLKIIHRHNLSLEEMAATFRWAKKNNMLTATEIMHGLPGETYESYLVNIENLYQIRVDSGSSHEVWLLPNTELALPESRQEHKFISRFTLGADALSIINGKVFCEFDEHLVGSKYISIEEHYKLCELDFFVALTLHSGYLRELTYHALTFGVNPIAIFKDIVGNHQEYPVLNKVFATYNKKIRESHFTSKEEGRQYISSILESQQAFAPNRFAPVVIGGFIFSNEFEKGVDEFISSITKLYNDTNGLKEEFASICEELKKVTIGMVINPQKQEEDVFIMTNYDFPRWLDSYYEEKLCNLKSDPIKLRLALPNPLHLKDIYEKGRHLTQDSERIQLFFRHTNSSCIRRRVSYAN